jgi:hypothetical protein
LASTVLFSNCVKPSCIPIQNEYYFNFLCKLH